MGLSKIEYLILSLLRSGTEMYGLEMIRDSAGQLKTGTIYVTLGRMLDKKYVTSRQSEQQNYPGMPRRLYQITGIGQSILSSANMVHPATSWGYI